MTPNNHKASGTMVSFRISKSAPVRHGERKMGGRQWCSAPALAVAPKTTDSLSGVMTCVFAGIFHETHSFTGKVTGLDGFVIHRGEEILLAAAMPRRWMAFLNAKAGRLCPAPFYTGGASGTVDHAVFEAFWSEVKPVLEKALAEGLECRLLVAAGPMVTSHCDDPEGELMRASAPLGAPKSCRCIVSAICTALDAQDGRSLRLHDSIGNARIPTSSTAPSVVDCRAFPEDGHQAQTSGAGDADRLAAHGHRHPRRPHAGAGRRGAPD